MTTAGAETRRRRIRVALVDDHLLLVEGLAARLSAPRARIEVVAALTDWQPLLDHPDFPVDVVVVEFGLEDDVPFETKVQQLGDRGIAAVALARTRDAATVHAALTAGALTLVPKSDPAEHLVAAVHAAADGRAHHSPSVQEALDAWANRADPTLGRQELTALQLYAQGRSVHEVALHMATTDQTAKSYIKRGRRKYRAAGVDLGTKLLLRRHAIREGWIPPE
ncbi:response regulator transcription factor [Amnibacterium kyonggiense]|uniref:LuxR family two component transcriptional regulator n=1 Tax=Amnibacterium kyonggiense TaxID=595671 RepID=A0A4R7FHQ7_9MICO|nr:response regulator transcription factor [Amnibacterium kyonggiense]TDS75864.1 LuxR family two component transcriptional regulator [Amnibacterium kyonggiense]